MATEDARLTELLDREAIRDCIYRYCRGIDRADEASLRSSYRPDATDRHEPYAGPVEGAANHALIEFLSQTLNVPANQIDIVAGEFSERKLITLVGVTPEQVDAASGGLSPRLRSRPRKRKKPPAAEPYRRKRRSLKNRRS